MDGKRRPPRTSTLPPSFRLKTDKSSESKTSSTSRTISTAGSSSASKDSEVPTESSPSVVVDVSHDTATTDGEDALDLAATGGANTPDASAAEEKCAPDSLQLLTECTHEPCPKDGPIVNRTENDNSSRHMSSVAASISESDPREPEKSTHDRQSEVADLVNPAKISFKCNVEESVNHDEKPEAAPDFGTIQSFFPSGRISDISGVYDQKLTETVSTMRTHTLNVRDLVRSRGSTMLTTISRSETAPLHISGDVSKSEGELDNYYVISLAGCPLYARSGAVDTQAFIVIAGAITATLGCAPPDEELSKIVTTDGIIIFKRAPHCKDERMFICDSRDTSNMERLSLALDYLRYQVTAQFPYDEPLPNELGVYNDALEIESVINLAENDLGACFAAVSLLPMSARLRANVATKMRAVLAAKSSGLVMCIVLVEQLYIVCILTTNNKSFTNIAHPVNIHMLQNWVHCNTVEYRGKKVAKILLPKQSDTQSFTVYQATVSCDVDLVFVSDKLLNDPGEIMGAFVEFQNNSSEMFVKTGYDEDLQVECTNNKRISVDVLFRRIVKALKTVKVTPAISALLETQNGLKAYSDLLIQCVFVANNQYFCTYIQQPAGGDALLTEEKVKAINEEYYALRQQMNSFGISQCHEVISDLGAIEARKYPDIEIFAAFMVDAEIEKIEIVMNILIQWIGIEKLDYLPGGNYLM